MITEHIPSPAANGLNKANTLYTGDRKSPVVEDMIQCNPEGPLLCQVTKMYPSQDATVFHALTRVYSGTLYSGQEVRVLGESFTLEDEEDSRVHTVSRLWIHNSRSVKTSLQKVLRQDILLICRFLNIVIIFIKYKRCQVPSRDKPSLSWILGVSGRYC